MKFPKMLVLVPIITLAACGPESAPQDPPVSPSSEPAPISSGLASGEAAIPDDAPLVPEAVRPFIGNGLRLQGELGCNFSRASSGEMLFFAAADVADEAMGEGAVVLAGKPVKLVMDGRGGFSALSDGARFSGPEGLAANITVTVNEPLVEEPGIAMESSRYRASFTLESGMRTITVNGIWECGP